MDSTVFNARGTLIYYGALSIDHFGSFGSAVRGKSVGSLRILIVDDHEAVLQGVRSLLSSRTEWLVCGEARDGVDAVEKAKTLRPDVVLMDISMPRMDGLQAARIIRHEVPESEVVIVSQNDPALVARQAATVDASGYVSKSDLSHQLLPVVDRIVAHRSGVKAKTKKPRGGRSKLTEKIRILQPLKPTALVRESERRFREMIDALPAAIYTTDAEGQLTHFNPAAVEFSGRQPKLGTDQWCISWRMFRSDGSPLPLDECPMAVALREGRIPDGAELIAERPDGTRVWFTPFPRPLHDAEGKIVGGINLLLDITARKKAAEADGLLAAIVDSSDDAIVSKNLDGVITSWNEAAERMFGYSANEAIGQHITFIIPADRRDEETRIIAQIKRGERVDHFETIRVCKDGTMLDISVTISPVRNAEGVVVGASKVARDIGERKRAERALRESEERFRAIVETTPECVKLVAADGTLLQMNPPGLAMVGADRAEQVVGSNIYDVIAPQDRDRFRAFNERICRGEKGSLEFDLVTLDGVGRHMDTHAAPLRTADGSVVQLAVTRDVTERVRVQEQLRRSEEGLRTLADQLEKQVQSRTQELEQRNAEVLQQSEQLRELSNRLLQTQDDERRHIARELHDSAGQIIAALGMNLASMTQHVRKNPMLGKALDDSQTLVQQLNKEIRTTSYLLHPPLLDESGLPEAIRWYMHGLTERSGLSIDLDIADDFGRLPNEVELAMFRIAQECLTNIHRHSGSKTAIVRLSRSTDIVSLEIQDQGKGIPAEKLDGIRAQRSGVGITGMRERIRHFNGAMDIHSNGKGTKISVTLPLRTLDTAQPENTFQEQTSAIAG
jgi:PAS domain S-box-containing protein